MIYFDSNKNAYAYEIPNYIATVEDDVWAQYATTDKWDIVDGEFIDITDTEEYKEKKTQEEKNKEIDVIKSQLNELDLKRIRAVCENEIKDPQTGETWLEFYNAQIKNLREKLLFS